MPRQSISAPAQRQLGPTTSPLVPALPSLHAVPGSGPPGQRSLASQVPSLSASAKVPAQVQFAPTTSFTVQALLSLHAWPGTTLGSKGQGSNASHSPSPSVSSDAAEVNCRVIGTDHVPLAPWKRMANRCVPAVRHSGILRVRFTFVPAVSVPDTRFAIWSSIQYS